MRRRERNDPNAPPLGNPAPPRQQRSFQEFLEPIPSAEVSIPQGYAGMIAIDYSIALSTIRVANALEKIEGHLARIAEKLDGGTAG